MNKFLLCAVLAAAVPTAQADVFAGSGSSSNSSSNSASGSYSSSGSASNATGGYSSAVGYGGYSSAGATGGAGGAANSGAANAGNAQNITFNSPPIPTTQQVISRTPGTTRIANTPDSTIIVPGATVPCFSSMGANVSTPGLGIGLGGGLIDKDCTAREDARTLVSMGLTQEAINRLCQRDTMRTALGSRCPQPMQPRARSADSANISAIQATTYGSRVEACKRVPDREFAACMRAAKG